MEVKMSSILSQSRVRFLILALMLAAIAGVLGVRPAYASTIPTISITNVVTDQTVTVQTYNFPPNQNFVVTMGPFGTQGIGGYVVATTNSGVGGSFSATYNIPDQLKGSYRIAIRLQTTHANPFFAYNWFYNNTTGTGGIPPTQPPPGPVYTGIPTFTVCSVVQNQTVTIRTNNMPPNHTFTVTMGPFGTQGIGGYVVGTLNSGAGGQLTATFNIPPQMAGAYRIAIRTQGSPWFAYNWFYNNTATVC
jgi:hypothetical protein